MIEAYGEDGTKAMTVMIDLSSFEDLRRVQVAAGQTW
jgi:hypothetical protein